MTARDDLLGVLERLRPSVTGPSMIPRQPTNVQLVDAVIAEALQAAADHCACHCAKEQQ